MNGSAMKYNTNTLDTLLHLLHPHTSPVASCSSRSSPLASPSCEEVWPPMCLMAWTALMALRAFCDGVGRRFNAINARQKFIIIFLARITAINNGTTIHCYSDIQKFNSYIHGKCFSITYMLTHK